MLQLRKRVERIRWSQQQNKSEREEISNENGDHYPHPLLRDFNVPIGGGKNKTIKILSERALAIHAFVACQYGVVRPSEVPDWDAGGFIENGLGDMQWDSSELCIVNDARQTYRVLQRILFEVPQALTHVGCQASATWRLSKPVWWLRPTP